MLSIGDLQNPRSFGPAQEAGLFLCLVSDGSSEWISFDHLFIVAVRPAMQVALALGRNGCNPAI
jgi:hypothetical protein